MIVGRLDLFNFVVFGHFPKDDIQRDNLQSDNLPRDNFPNVHFPKRQLSKD